MILPGQTLGVLGDGPAGKMLAQAAESLGYRARIFPGIDASRDGFAGLRAFAGECAAVSCASEIISTEALDVLAETARLHPSRDVLHLGRSRLHQKHWLAQNKFSQAACAEVLDGDVAAAVARVGRPCVVKMADFSLEGRGQMRIANDADLEQASVIFQGRRCLVERWIDFAAELSVLVARSESGEMRLYPLVENIHARGVLDFSIVPARMSEAAAVEVQHLARDLAKKLGVVGLLAVELFLTDRGELLVNAFAPGTHPSGDWTLDGSETNQFEQQIRAVCGLPLGPTDRREPSVTVGIYGEAWRGGRDPDWTVILREPRAKLHLFGGLDPRPGRRMGYFSVRASEVGLALELARELRASLLGRSLS
ncbi:MAG TPA: ATP-grasp domain-containing protein [Opitutaceae bacterium]|nr:ATP-grasp domain-containing protein [Opitutaceae bacterium]